MASKQKHFLTLIKNDNFALVVLLACSTRVSFCIYPPWLYHVDVRKHQLRSNSSVHICCFYARTYSAQPQLSILKKKKKNQY